MNFKNFLTSGELGLNFFIDDEINVAHTKMGKYLDHVGDDSAGYFYYSNGVRVGYVEKYIDEIELNFKEYKHLSFDVDSIFGERFRISGKSRIHEFIYFLNSNNVKWKCVDEKNLYSFIIKVNDVSLSFFDLNTGKLIKSLVSRRLR